jgi:hypothetical protein
MQKAAVWLVFHIAAYALKNISKLQHLSYKILPAHQLNVGQKI